MREILSGIIGGMVLGLLVAIIFGFGFIYCDKKSEKAEKHEVITESPTTEVELVSLGTFTVTHYCSCENCCGKSDGITASGVVATENHTVAASSDIPFGTVLVVNGIEYVVEDRGGAITDKRIDIYCATHQEALEKGVYQVEVFKKGE